MRIERKSTANRIERKFFPFQLKATSAQKQDAPVSFSGYGSVFGTVDSYSDTIEKGAFLASLNAWKAKGKFPKMLLQHGGGWGGSAEDLIPVGAWAEMYEDDHGLFCSGALLDFGAKQPPDRFVHMEAAIRAKELDGLSIGFYTRKYAIDDTTDVRTLIEIDLVEVSIVTFPANDPARLDSVKSGELPSQRELERILRDGGLSRSQARGVLAKGYSALCEAGSEGIDPALREAESGTVKGVSTNDVRSLLAAVGGNR